MKKDNILLRQGKPVSAFVVPLITRSKVIGVMATDGVDGKGVPRGDAGDPGDLCSSDRYRH